MTFPLPTVTLHDANVFDNSPSFEIELELDNERIYQEKQSGKYANVQELIGQMRKCIRFILSGLQGTPFPISYVERKEVLDSYMCRMFGDTWKETKRPFPFFLGPSSKTLQQENILPTTESILSSVVRIETDYTVTEKADGLRCLLYVSNKGRVYLINSNLKVIFTGSATKEKRCFDSIIDGEFIAHGKPPERRFIFLFLAFDIYYFGGLETLAHVRELPFTKANLEEVDKVNTRLAFLQQFDSFFKLESVSSSSCNFRFGVKTFAKQEINEVTKNASIFDACGDVWAKRHMFEYEVDGLIFTPMSPGVGGEVAGQVGPLGKMTWSRSFKWKPPHYNTIDFLVMVKKDKDGQELVKHIIRDQDNMMSSIVQYKVLELHCGMDVSKYIQHRNLLNDVMTDNYRGQVNTESKQKYRAVPFHPSEPYNPDAHLCFIALETDIQSKGRMKTLEGDYFDDYTIVEFSYAKDDLTKDGPWKWVPLRVRFDKTQELREGKTNYGNDVTTANSNWRSIHFPIDEQTITGKHTLTEVQVVDTIYYQLKDKSNLKTGGLRDFHNLYVKSKLIEGLSQHLRQQSKMKEILLIDYAVGKAGDLPKWQRSKLAFVFGLDLSTENIMDPDDGACIRYLNSRKKNSHSSLRAMFLQANSGLNIRTKGDAFSSVSEKELSQYIFGNGGGHTNTKYTFPYGLAKDGFHISSCQFALHYFFQNNTTLHSFLRNVAECTALNGYFIGTCFDGEKVFKYIHRLNKNESITISRDGSKIFEMVKKYSSTIKEFPANESSVGLSIDVFQESIDKTFSEYLVHFEYFERLMANYGFKLVDDAVLQSIGLSKATDGFDSLFQHMKVETEKKAMFQNAWNMSKEEKDISFLNRYFIFQKVRELSQPTLKNLQGETENEQPPQEKEMTKRRKLNVPKIAMNDDNYSPIEST